MPTFHAADSPEAEKVRELARLGRLAEVAGKAAPMLRMSIWSGAHDIAAQVVFQRITVPVERGRHHFDCASGFQHLRPDCLDRFHEAVEALVNDTLRRATIAILNLDAWMASRASAATIDDHRSRRGARGAQQRPYVPQWLRQRLDDNAWLTELAHAMLTWVGIPDTAGTDLWPVDAWTDRRAQHTGDHETSTPATVRREIDTVLAAMRHRPDWYTHYVQGPLERKPVAVAPSVRTWDGGLAEPPPLALVGASETHDAALRDLAGRCLEAIRAGIAVPGADRAAVVTEAIRLTFCAWPGDPALAPFDDTDPDVDAIISDPAAAARIVAVVLDILDITDDVDGALFDGPVMDECLLDGYSDIVPLDDFTTDDFITDDSAGGHRRPAG